MPTQEYSSDHAFWNPMFILFFVVLGTFFYLFFTRHEWFIRELYSLDLYALVLMSLATFRIIRLMTYDKITQFLRDIFLDHRDGLRVKPQEGFRRAAAELFECVWCTGAWGALTVLALYFIAPWGMLIIYILAISALGTVFQNLSQMIVRIGTDAHR